MRLTSRWRVREEPLIDGAYSVHAQKLEMMTEGRQAGPVATANAEVQLM